MDYATKCGQFLAHFTNKEYSKALKMVIEVKQELQEIEKLIQKEQCKLSNGQREALSLLKESISRIDNGQKEIAANKAKQADIKFANQRMESLIKDLQTSSSSTASNKLQPDSKLGTPVESGERYHQPRSSTSGVDKGVVMNDDILLRSKKAGQALRTDNPELADLSDLNRPTKIAERFSELYDNEWTEGYESLQRHGMLEREIIETLFEVVYSAYAFCKQENEKQLKESVSVCLNILNGRDTVSEKARVQDEHLLVQFRKSNAERAVESVKKKFMNNQQLRGIADRAVDKYALKVVELTWWMCVQDPPIHMCSEISGDPNLYRAYTKSGTHPDFIVWPALKLHKDGGILFKGVMQYK